MICIACQVLLLLGLGEVLPVPLETPAFPSSSVILSGNNPTLELLESTPNSVTGYGEWFGNLPSWQSLTFHNGGLVDAIRGTEPPPGVEPVLLTPGEGRFHLYQVIRSGSLTLSLYGDPPNRYGVVLNPRILVIMDPLTRRTIQVLDFLAYATGLASDSADPQLTFQQLRWAEVADGVLYVENAHRTYAESSSGMNGYITAIELATLRVLWRSGPLVANAENFVIAGDHIICGYGFTDEEDNLFILDRLTGNVAEKVSVPSAPEFLALRGDILNVRCYSSDLVFRLAGPAPD